MLAGAGWVAGWRIWRHSDSSRSTIWAGIVRLASAMVLLIWLLLLASITLFLCQTAAPVMDAAALVVRAVDLCRS